MNIYTLIKKDHRKVQALLKELSREKTGSKAEAVFHKIKRELELHNHAEEAVFYSKLTATRTSRVLALEGKREHDLGAELLQELSALDGASEEFAAKAKVLRDLVEHHVKEEEGQVHKQAKKELSAEEARRIGEEFTRFKRKPKLVVTESERHDIRVSQAV